MTDRPHQPAPDAPSLGYWPLRNSGLRVRPSGVVGLTLMALLALGFLILCLATGLSDVP
jgi:hypothetical protein